MRWFLCIVVAIATTSSAPVSRAAVSVVAGSPTSVVAPDWQPGSTWEYSDGYGLRVVSSGGGVTTFERLDSAGQWFSMRGFLRQDAASATSRRQTVFRTVPPEAGERLAGPQPLTFQREYLSNGELIVHATSWSVEGRERITVPAGTFDCWVIVWRARSLKSDWTGFERWWYSPEVQNYVRLEYKYGSTPTASRVLMRYGLSMGVDDSTAAIDPVVVRSSAVEVKPVGLPAALPGLPKPEPLAAIPLPDPEPEPLLRSSFVDTAKVHEIAKGQGPTPGHWFVQIAAVSDEWAAKNELSALGVWIDGHPNGIEKADLGERGIFYRVWVGDYEEPSAADALCRDMKTAGNECFVRRR